MVFLDDDASMPTADFELLPGLAGIALPLPGEGESYISVRVKVVDLSEIGGDSQRPRRYMQVTDVGLEGYDSQRV